MGIIIFLWWYPSLEFITVITEEVFHVRSLFHPLKRQEISTVAQVAEMEILRNIMLKARRDQKS